jgi:hypothetical protein
VINYKYSENFKQNIQLTIFMQNMNVLTMNLLLKILNMQIYSYNIKKYNQLKFFLKYYKLILEKILNKKILLFYLKFLNYILKIFYMNSFIKNKKKRLTKTMKKYKFYTRLPKYFLEYYLIKLISYNYLDTFYYIWYIVTPIKINNFFINKRIEYFNLFLTYFYSSIKYKLNLLWVNFICQNLKQNNFLMFVKFLENNIIKYISLLNKNVRKIFSQKSYYYYFSFFYNLIKMPISIKFKKIIYFMLSCLYILCLITKVYLQKLKIFYSGVSDKHLLSTKISLLFNSNIFKQTNSNFLNSIILSKIVIIKSLILKENTSYFQANRMLCKKYLIKNMQIKLTHYLYLQKILQNYLFLFYQQQILTYILNLFTFNKNPILFGEMRSHFSKYTKFPVFSTEKTKQLFFNTLSCFFFAFYQNDPDLLAREIALRFEQTGRRQKHSHTIKEIIKLLNRMKSIGNIVGFKILISGKINAKTQTKARYIKFGKSIATNNFSLLIKYAHVVAYTYTGTFAIHVWFLKE